jgi:hypothetical protein
MALSRTRLLLALDLVRSVAVDLKHAGERLVVGHGSD